MQEFALKVDLSLTLPVTEAKAAAKKLSEEIRFALIARGANLLKLFPEVGAARRRPSADEARDDPQGLMREGPVEATSTLSADEARQDVEALIRAMKQGSLTGEELFSENEEADGDQGTTGRPPSPLT